MPLKKIEIPTRKARVGGFILEIPVDWVVGRNDRGYDWAGNEGDTITLLTKVEFFDVPNNKDTADRSPAQFAEEFARHSIQAIPDRQLIAPISVDRIQSGCVVSILEDFEGESRRLRTYQWHVVHGRTDHIAVTFWILEFSYPLPSDDHLLQLYELFKRQAFSKEVVISDASRGDATPLKDLTVDALFTIRIPDWFDYERVVRPDGHAIWSCWAANGRPGKLLIANEFGTLSSDLRGLDAAALLRTFESHLDQRDDPERLRISKTEIKAPLGQVLRVIEDEKPRPLELDNLDRLYVRYHQWFYTMTDGQSFLRLFFNLSFPIRKFDHPDAAILPDLIEREILALRPLPPFEPIPP
jgi:hypothetical protein